MSVVHHVWFVLDSSELCDHFVSVALVDEEPLTLPGEGHLGGVLADEGVEEGVVLLGYGSLFGSQNTTQPGSKANAF